MTTYGFDGQNYNALLLSPFLDNCLIVFFSVSGVNVKFVMRKSRIGKSQSQALTKICPAQPYGVDGQ